MADSSERQSVVDEGPKEAVDGETLHARALHALIEERRRGSARRGGGLWILLVTLFIFMGVHLTGNKLVDMAILVFALMIHEGGHFLAMKIFGYRDLRVFFIPAFGAAAMGRNVAAPAWQRAVVALAGPLPGLALGFAFAVLWALTGKGLFGHMSLVFVVLNAFNLLPFQPLDGGRFLFEILLRRSRHLEVLTRGLALMALLLLASLLGDWILAIFVLLLLGSVGEAWAVATVAAEHGARFPLRPEERGLEHPPPAHAEEILKALLRRGTPVAAVGIFERRLEAVWQRLMTRPPGPAVTISFLFAYGAAGAAVIFLPLLALLFWVQDVDRPVTPPRDGVHREIGLRRFGLDQWRCGLDGEGLLHGPCEAAWPPLCSIPLMKGRFEHGRFSGAFVYHGPDGRVVQRVEYEAGRPVRWARKNDEGSWQEETLDESKDGKLFRSLSPAGKDGGRAPLGAGSFRTLLGRVTGLLSSSSPPPLLFR